MNRCLFILRHVLKHKSDFVLHGQYVMVSRHKLIIWTGRINKVTLIVGARERIFFFCYKFDLYNKFVSNFVLQNIYFKTNLT
jgi:hypothetical protein